MKSIRVAILLALAAAVCAAEELPIVETVEFQPFAAQVSRVLQALELVGEPLPAEDAKEVQELVQRGPPSPKTMERLQRILDKYCLAGVDINPESRVKVQQGQAAAELVEQGWRAFLVKVRNEAGITPVLAVESRNAGPIPNQPQGMVNIRWMDLQMFNKQPMKVHLSGLELEYRILQLFAKEAGKREAKLAFDVGQGSQDLGFRNEVDILFTIKPSAKVTFRVRDWNDQPTTGSFLIRDEQQRVYPSQT
ncbi:MAG: CehA/McbA family metallohydrolase, partial [Bryobacteraceae bacterium]